MHPADIKAALQKAGSSQTAIARARKVSKTTVSDVIYGRTTSRPIADLIAEATGLTVEQIWPGKYRPDDNNANNGGAP
jgi:lambda repressor-like predicted transcriptional regulator